MNRSDAAREVKSRYAEYLQEARKRIGGKPTYVCPLCNNGTGEDGTGMSIDPSAKNPYTLHCFKCDFHGDIIDLYQQQHACDAGTAFRALYSRFGIVIDDSPADRAESPQGTTNGAQRGSTPPAQEKPAEGRTGAVERKPDYTEYYKACKARVNDKAAAAYLQSRGISPETAARFLIGYDPAADPASVPGAMGNEYKPHPCPRIIIPLDKSHYMGRSIDPKTEKPFLKMNSPSLEDDPTGTPLFNLKAIKNNDGRPIFVCEGAIDALSIAEIGHDAIGLNGASNTRKLIDQVKERQTRCTFILCLDKDDTGRKKTETLAEGLRGLNVPFVTADICGQQKDPNAALTADRAAFIEAVGEAERKAARPDNAADYIRQQMADEITALKPYVKRKTGFPNLDKQTGGIYPGLYVIGGTSSVGKTTFMHQIADQMAEQGQHVLFFSMEQSRLEMASKSISRLTAIKDERTAAYSIDIRQGYLPAQVLDAVDEYASRIGDRLSIIEGNFSCNASFIGEYTRDYIKNNGVKPIVIVDYLQVVQAEIDPETGRKPTDAKAVTDYNVTAFRRMSRALGTPVFLISSVNRSNYLTPIDFEAFKESGSIEYTADVVWGLQLSAIHDPIFDKETGIKAKREKISKEKDAIPRDVELVCLKNRYGRCRYTVNFTYYPQYDYFVPREDGEAPASKPARRV